MYFLTATRMALIEHLRNRLALWLVLLYIPLWLVLAHTVIASAPVHFRLRATGDVLLAASNDLCQIGGQLNAATQIVGFMMFTVTFRSSTFDRRLALAGFPRLPLVAAKVTALALSSLVISCYATAITVLFWQPHQVWLVAAGVCTGALTYGALGVMLGALLKGELEGMFLVLMSSLIDTAMQNPVFNPGADADLLQFLPSYGAMQTAVAGAFTDLVPMKHLALQLTWFGVLTAFALVVFLIKTRDRRPAHGQSRPTEAEPILPDKR